MILDKPKRRAETIVGVVKVDNGEGLTNRKNRMIRAIKDAEDQFSLKISNGDLFGEINHSGDLVVISLTITAVIHTESLESRWARALDMIRDQYGLTIEWERGEVREVGDRPNFAKFAEQFTDHIADSLKLPKEVLTAPMDGTYTSRRMRDLEMARQVEEVRQHLYSDNSSEAAWHDGLMAIDGVLGVEIRTGEPGELWPIIKYSGYVKPDREEIAHAIARVNPCGCVTHGSEAVAVNSGGLVESFTFEEIVPPVEERFGEVGLSFNLEDTGSLTFSDGHVTPAEVAAQLTRTGDRLVEDYPVETTGGDSTLTIGPGETIKPRRKSYADTPTGTVEHNAGYGGYLRMRVETVGGHTAPFSTALHLEIVDDYSNLLCPVCGETTAEFWMRHVSDFYKPVRDHVGRDAYAIEKIGDGFTCDACHHHLAYDFKNETVTIRRGE